MRKGLFLFGIFYLAFFYVFANTNEEAQNIQCPSKFKAGEIANERELNAACAYPGRIKVNNECGFFVTGSFLYWQMLSEQFDYIWLENTTTKTMEKKEWEYKYKPAFKVAIGYNFSKHDDWQILAEYIRYNAHNHTSYSVDTNENSIRVPYWMNIIPYGNSTQASMDLTSNFINLTLGRPYYLGYKLICSPFFGARGWWMKHTLDGSVTHIESDVSYTGVAHHKATSWAVGARFGMEAKYLIGAGARVFGKAVGNLLYRENKEKSEIPQVAEGYNLYYTYIENNTFLSPELELGIGFGYGFYFDKMKYHFDLAASYDFTIFWNHEVIANFYENLYSEIPAAHLYLHGLTLSATFDF